MFKVGVIGGGQLARMMHPQAIALGIELRVFSEAENSSAHAATTQVGDYTKLAELREFAADVDVITFDHEHVPIALLENLEQSGVSVQPPSKALTHAQNKLVMRRRLSELGLPQPAWRSITSAADLDDFLNQQGGRAIVKTPIGGYDGRGVRIASSAADISDWLENLDSYGGSLLAEQLVDFKRELAQLSARTPSGEFRHWPVVQTVQENGVCSEVIAPAPAPVDHQAAVDIAKRVAEGLGVTGVLAVELFETESGELFVNELAMRPHNSGHFSIEAAVTSQFEQHLRAVLNLPLGETELVASAAVMINLLGVDDANSFVEHYPAAMERFPQAKFHSYQKAARKGRKMGHITVVGDDADELLRVGRAARDVLYNRGA